MLAAYRLCSANPFHHPPPFLPRLLLGLAVERIPPAARAVDAVARRHAAHVLTRLGSARARRQGVGRLHCSTLL